MSCTISYNANKIVRTTGNYYSSQCLNKKELRSNFRKLFYRSFQGQSGKKPMNRFAMFNIMSL